jgi:hypothetical protein
MLLKRTAFLQFFMRDAIPRRACQLSYSACLLVGAGITLGILTSQVLSTPSFHLLGSKDLWQWLFAIPAGEILIHQLHVGFVTVRRSSIFGAEPNAQTRMSTNKTQPLRPLVRCRNPGVGAATALSGKPFVFVQSVRCGSGTCACNPLGWENGGSVVHQLHQKTTITTRRGRP